MSGIIPAMYEAPPAGFWLRAIAFAIDVMVVGFVQGSFNLVAAIVFGVGPDQAFAISSTVSFFGLVFAALYTSVLHATGGQTIGKHVVGARVVALDGDPPLGGAAFLRWLAYFASFATFGFGFLMAGLRSDKRALHDLLAGTRVERVAHTRRNAPAAVGSAEPAAVAGAPVGEPAPGAAPRETPPPPTP
jgi:uncharacterized RDD family membrane protein YckC